LTFNLFLERGQFALKSRDSRFQFGTHGTRPFISLRNWSCPQANQQRLASISVQPNAILFFNSISDSLFQTGLVDLCGFVVGGFGGGAFGFADLVFLGVPADFKFVVPPLGGAVLFSSDAA
jgi:hypothetical protein